MDKGDGPEIWENKARPHGCPPLKNRNPVGCYARTLTLKDNLERPKRLVKEGDK